MPREKTPEKLREEEDLLELKREIASQLVTELARRDYSQKDLCRLTGDSNSTVSMYKNHPSTMSDEFIRRLAAAKPEAYGWAWRRYNQIVSLKGADASPGDSDEQREIMDQLIEAARVLLARLEYARKRLP